MSNELSRPKLIFRIVGCFSPALYAQFAHEYKDLTAWRFETVLMFMDDVIGNLPFKDRHTYDISTIIGENSSSSNEKLSIVQKTSSYWVNKLQGQKLSTTVTQLSAQHSSEETMSVDKQNKCQLSTMFRTSNLCRIHPLARHKTIDCYEFLKMDVKERCMFVKAHGLCFYCLGKHLAKHCSEKQSCPICQGGHSELLHQQRLPNNKFGEPQLQRNEDKRNQRLVHQDVVNQDVIDGNLNAARPVKDDGAIEQQFETSVPIMALTAVKERLKDGKYEMHVSTDASNCAMGECVYLTKHCGNIIESSLVLGKSMLFPQTQVSRFSIAQKELLGLCMGADLSNQCIMYFTISITEIYVWVDSVTVIKWCQCSSKQLAQFVRNRVDKVMSAMKGRYPGYIQSTINPADIASRGIGVKK